MDPPKLAAGAISQRRSLAIPPPPFLQPLYKTRFIALTPLNQAGQVPPGSVAEVLARDPLDPLRNLPAVSLTVQMFEDTMATFGKGNIDQSGKEGIINRHSS